MEQNGVPVLDDKLIPEYEVKYNDDADSQSNSNDMMTSAIWLNYLSHHNTGLRKVYIYLKNMDIKQL